MSYYLHGQWMGNCYKGFGDRRVLSMYLGIFEDYRVYLLNQLTKTNKSTHGY